MQSEVEANAIAWGLSDFNKSSIKVLKSNDILLYKQSNEPLLIECISYNNNTNNNSNNNSNNSNNSNNFNIFSRGTCFEIGVEVTPISTWKKTIEEFIISWENQSEYLTFDLQIKYEDKIVPRETSFIQKLIQNKDRKILLDKKLIKRTSHGLFIGTVTSLRVPPQYLDKPLTLVLQLSVVVPNSKIPSNFRSGMNSEEQEVRALLETGRYHPPYLAPREISIPIKIIEALSIQCWSRNIDSWTSLSCIELKNTHPDKDIIIQHIGINLNSSLRAEAIPQPNNSINNNNGNNNNCNNNTNNNNNNNTNITNSLIPPLQCTSTNILFNENIDTSVLLSPCQVPIEPWFDVINLSHNYENNSIQKNDEKIHIKKGESHMIVYRISPRHIVNESLSTSNSSQNLFIPSTSGIPPSILSGHFLTPVDVWWIECPDLKNDSENTLSEFKNLCSEEDYIINTASLCWGIEKIIGKEFAVEIEGPSSIHPLHPVELQLRVSNLTSKERNIELYLQQPKEAHIFDNPPPPAILLNSEYQLLQQSQWKNSGIVNHHIIVPIKNLQPLKAASVSVYLFPLRQGVVEFSDLHIIDEETRELFKLNHPYSLLIQ